MPKYDFYPQNPEAEKVERFTVKQVSIWRYEVQIEQEVGIIPDGRLNYPVSRVATYGKVTEASAKRLNQVMSQIVNQGQATVHLALPHGVEFEL